MRFHRFFSLHLAWGVAVPGTGTLRSVFHPRESVFCRIERCWPGIRLPRVKTAEKVLADTNEFCVQVTRFCPLVRQELLERWDQVDQFPVSAHSALMFAETLMLCPTPAAVRVCIRRDLCGALSFLFAVQGIQQRIERGSAKLPRQNVESSTTFFLLACAVQDYLGSLRKAEE